MEPRMRNNNCYYTASKTKILPHEEALRERQAELEELRRRSLTKDYATRLQDAEMPWELKLNNFEEQQRQSIQEAKARLKEAKINLNNYRSDHKNPWDVHYQQLYIHQQESSRLAFNAKDVLKKTVFTKRTAEHEWVEKGMGDPESSVRVYCDLTSPMTADTEAIDWTEMSPSPVSTSRPKTFGFNHDRDSIDGSLTIPNAGQRSLLPRKETIMGSFGKRRSSSDRRVMDCNRQFADALSMLQSSAHFDESSRSMSFTEDGSGSFFGDDMNDSSSMVFDVKKPLCKNVGLTESGPTLNKTKEYARKEACGEPRSANGDDDEVSNTSSSQNTDNNLGGDDCYYYDENIAESDTCENHFHKLDLCVKRTKENECNICSIM